ncbi:Solute carrier family 35 member F6 [Hypsibius exemplaris]|uniref:Solute carrier family 35 member F6 n=1 Tax=Hypsibius exemplaris TaxID=2072580 RepID=A0A9X6RMF4_HYPEX|nr:Solute carrier family 35 member F6 [Hypsibius exemplaris]
MAWTTFQIIIATVMLLTGSLNTLIAKWTDQLKATGRDDGAPREFNHPFVQACAMFLGEFLCLVAFAVVWGIRRQRSASVSGDVDVLITREGQQQPFTWRNSFVFLPPALCDMTATSIMYVGLNMTYASSFQMLRGAVIIFTALLSAIVGISDIVFNQQANADMNSIITGDLLIIMAQIIAACQMVYEEKFLSKYDVPALVAVGLEGFFGFTVLAIILVPLAYIPAGSFSATPFHTVEDAIDAFAQMRNNYLIVIGLVGTIFSIAFFNYAGISVTKEINATTRMVLDSLRTLIIWAVSLGLKWQKFQYLQIIGFILLVIGMAVYNGILNKDQYVRVKRRVVTTIWKDNGSREVLVRDDDIIERH